MTGPLLTRAPGSPPEPLAEYRAAGGYDGLRTARGMAPEEVVALVTAAELRGRGGAAFPTGRKWDLARKAAGPEKHVLANGGEHEPGSRKDRVLLATRPHLVLEGTAIGAHATGATEAWIYLLADMADGVAAVRGAIGEADAAGLLGALRVRVQIAPPTYVAGEETAAIAAVEGQPAKPRKKPPYPGESGIGGKPTTVNNVETLAHVPGIVRNGAEWFRGLGVPGSAGTMLLTLPEGVRKPGVVEVGLGKAAWREVVEDLGGGTRSGRPVRAVLPALSCSWLPAPKLEARLDHDSMKAAGSSLGCGGVTLLEAGECAVERTLEIARFFMREQCGQCPPCRMETNTIAAVLEKTARGEPGDYKGQVEKIAAFTRKKGFCSLIEMAAAPVLSALSLFPEDFEAHARTGRCGQS
ncbi:MAG: hypothetical protein L0216_13085 [Planctomycetales bacterium]|nr:hypothetical protein [Planctomycetales bacterium]